MIPASYTTLAAVVFVVGGLLTCFAGFRLFRIVLALYGFFAGAMIGSHLADSGNAWAVAMYGLVGGVVGAALMVVAYFIGVGLIGAGLAALVLNVAWKAIGGEPPAGPGPHLLTIDASDPERWHYIDLARGTLVANPAARSM